MIKVAIDTSPLYNLSRTRGIGVYTNNLLEELEKNNKIEIIQVKSGQLNKDMDLIHYPFFDFFFLTLPVLKTKKTIVTIHDCIPLVFPEKYPPGKIGKIRFTIQKFALKNVSAVITDSESSKNDIVKYLNVPKEKVHVIYLAPSGNIKINSDSKDLGRIKEKYNLPDEFVLYVGDVNYNKNLPGIIKACEKAGIPLVWVGKQSQDTKSIALNIEEQPLVEVNELIREFNNVLRLGYIDEKDLSGVYGQATVYCQPSFYEGFGLQILEAMVCGCPVITSKISSLPEVAGKAAILVDPNNINEISEAIGKIRKDDKIKELVIKAGFQQVKKFNWQKTAEETIKIYEKILEK